MNIAHLREEYRRARLDESDAAADPLTQFHKWFDDARAAEQAEPNAMALATADSAGIPNCRMVLLKEADARGFTFFTDYRSTKSGELAANAHAALCFFWGALERQVRIVGRAQRVTVEESAAYFAERPRGSRLGAWASTQSAPIASRAALEARHAELDRDYTDDDIPLPSHWGGFRVIPAEYEFWQGRQNRLHDRLRYRPGGVGWIVERLSP